MSVLWLLMNYSFQEMYFDEEEFGSLSVSLPSNQEQERKLSPFFSRTRVDLSLPLSFSQRSYNIYLSILSVLLLILLSHQLVHQLVYISLSLAFISSLLSSSVSFHVSSLFSMLSLPMSPWDAAYLLWSLQNLSCHSYRRHILNNWHVFILHSSKMNQVTGFNQQYVPKSCQWKC